MRTNKAYSGKAIPAIIVICLCLLSLFTQAQTHKKGASNKQKSTLQKKHTTTAKKTPEAISADDSLVVPVFSSEEANKGIADFQLLMGKYITALQQKDTAGITRFNGEYAAWVEKVMDWAPKLSPEEIQLYSTYMQQAAAKWIQESAQYTTDEADQETGSESSGTDMVK